MNKKSNPTGSLNSLFGRAKQGVNLEEESGDFKQKQKKITKTITKQSTTQQAVDIKESLPTSQSFQIEESSSDVQANPKQLYDKKHTVIRVEKDLYLKFSEIAKISKVPAKRIIEMLIIDLIKSKKPIFKIAELIEKSK